MKKLLLLLSLISFNAFATDRGVPCNSNSCKVKIVTKDSGGTDVTSGEFSSTGLKVTGLVGAQCGTLVTDGSVAGCTYFRQNSTQTVQGLTGGVSGQLIVICSSAAATTTLVHGGTGVQTFRMGTAANAVLSGNDCASFVYDSTENYWRAFGFYGFTP